MSKPTTLYRLFDEDDELLYVGISSAFGQRFGQHRDGKAWWPDVVTARLVHYEDRPAAADAERKAIATESPRYNGERTGSHTWNIRDVPDDLLHRAKVAAAQHGQSLRVWVIEAVRERLERLATEAQDEEQ